MVLILILQNVLFFTHFTLRTQNPQDNYYNIFTVFGHMSQVFFNMKNVFETYTLLYLSLASLLWQSH